MSMQSATCEIPAFPGAQKSLLHLGDFAIAQQSACSLPPEPTTKIIIEILSSLFKLLLYTQAHLYHKTYQCYDRYDPQFRL